MKEEEKKRNNGHMSKYCVFLLLNKQKRNCLHIFNDIMLTFFESSPKYVSWEKHAYDEISFYSHICPNIGTWMINMQKIPILVIKL